jgi:hypothetical protein
LRPLLRLYKPVALAYFAIGYVKGRFVRRLFLFRFPDNYQGEPGPHMKLAAQQHMRQLIESEHREGT